MEKTCNKCGKTLDISNFDSKGWISGKQRLRGDCRKCRSDVQKSRAKRAIRKQYEQRNKGKIMVRNRFRAMVAQGKIKKLPCIVCGDIKSEAHHFDYNKVFEVVWLCRKHHWELHVFNSTKLPQPH